MRLRCHAAGIRVIMITGDHPQTARAVARQIGLVQSEQPTIVTGDQLHRMSIAQLQLALNHDEVIFARVAADQKMRIVSALEAEAADRGGDRRRRQRRAGAEAGRYRHRHGRDRHRRGSRGRRHGPDR